MSAKSFATSSMACCSSSPSVSSSTVELETDGDDESEAMETIAKLFADKFGEGE